MCKGFHGNPGWSDAANSAANDFIHSKVLAGETLTSLEVKSAVRAAVGPDDPVSQTDASKFLRKWLHEVGESLGWEAKDTTVGGNTFLTYSKGTAQSTTKPAPVKETSSIVSEPMVAVQKEGFLKKLWRKLFD